MMTLFGTNLHHSYVGVRLYYLLYNHTSFIIYSLFLNANTDFKVTLLKCFYKHISLNYMAHKSKYIKKTIQRTRGQKACTNSGQNDGKDITWMLVELFVMVMCIVKDQLWYSYSSKYEGNYMWIIKIVFSCTPRSQSHVLRACCCSLIFLFLTQSESLNSC